MQEITNDISKELSKLMKFNNKQSKMVANQD